MVERKRIMERCRVELLRELGLEERDVLDALVGDLFGRRTRLPLAQALAWLVRTGYPPARLVIALKACELKHLRIILPETVGSSPQQQVEQLLALAHHYADAQLRWLEQLVRLPRPETTVADLPPLPPARFPIPDGPVETDRDRERQLREQALAGWLKHRRVQFFNYFYELQVSSLVPVEDLEGDFLTVCTTPKLERVFAAGEGMRYAYAPTPDPELALRVELFKAEGEELILRVLNLMPHPQGRRVRVRVRVIDDIPVVLEQQGRSYRGRVLDLSENGLGLLFDRSLGVMVDDEVSCVSTLRTLKHEIELQSRGVVHSCQELDQGVRIGLELDLDPEERLKLQSVLVWYEQAIIQRLRNLGTPQLLR